MDGGFPRTHAATECCSLTTRGRTTGREHEIEIWFGVHGDDIVVIGGHVDTDWLRNLRVDPAVRVRIGADRREGTARLVDDPDERRAVGRLMAAKYEHSLGPGDVTDDPRSWAFGATAVAVGDWR
jgi:deazaflavin-dependent oxidoreductase (nitroreductase family)